MHTGRAFLHHPRISRCAALRATRFLSRSGRPCGRPARPEGEARCVQWCARNTAPPSPSSSRRSRRRPWSGDQVRVRVEACGVNFPDTLIIENKYQFKPPLPFSPGGEAAGVITEVGADVKGWKVGDRVIAMCGWGGFVEEMALDPSRLMRTPEGMDERHGRRLHDDLRHLAPRAQGQGRAEARRDAARARRRRRRRPGGRRDRQGDGRARDRGREHATRSSRSAAATARTRASTRAPRT